MSANGERVVPTGRARAVHGAVLQQSETTCRRPV
jgi:hypothetical protein